jgi:hypothetical protein
MKGSGQVATWKRLVQNVAPGIAASLTGPAGGVAVRYLCEKFLGDANATEQDLAAAIESATPERLLELKRMEQDFQIRMTALGLDQERLYVSDRRDARQVLKLTIWPQVLLSGVFVVGYFTVLGLLVANSNADFGDRVFGILNTVIGVLTAAIPMILQFWFGSSLGSKEKDRMGR